MAPRTLLSSTIPIVLLPHDAPHTTTATGPPTELTVQLNHSPAEDQVTLTISDLSTRLLLLRHILTAAQYAPLRESQSLLIDFAAFPIHLCDLLQRVANSDDYVAILRLPHEQQIANAPNTPSLPGVLRVVQTSPVKSITHIELNLLRATHEELVAVVAGRAREAELSDARANRLQVELNNERAKSQQENQSAQEQITNLTATNERLRSQLSSSEQVSTRLAQETERMTTSVNDLQEDLRSARAEGSDTRAMREEMDRMREALGNTEAQASRSEEARRRNAVGLDEARREISTITSERDEAVREITRGNDIIDKLQSEVRNLRAKGRVKTAVIKRQEETVGQLEKKVAELQRDVRRSRDRAALLEVEKEGLNGRLTAALQKLEENSAVLASDQQVISYLNRELNERAIGDVRERNSPQPRRGASRGGAPPSADVGVSSGVV